jgi:hypothetical protein
MTSPQPTSHPQDGRAVDAAALRRALDDQDAHCRQRELVRLSLLARPAPTGPTHRRWAA